jgi:hypothetical protein
MKTAASHRSPRVGRARLDGLAAERAVDQAAEAR